jgi:SAM-dependent methyltransferase
MGVFSAYARYYDLLYRDKDYEAEAEYVQRLISRNAPRASSVLDLGCGTGRHAAALARRGFSVDGVDRSPEMLREARHRGRVEPAEVGNRLRFHEGDIRTVSLGGTFDVVVALFHVASYLTSNEDLARAFHTARQHLVPGGLFLFDCWYGPAVLTLGPEVRVKRLEDSEVQVTRIAEPDLDTAANCVTVRYTVLITDRRTQVTESVREDHCMRYMFLPEIRHLLADAGLAQVLAVEWMTERPASADTWSVCIGAAALPRA